MSAFFRRSVRLRAWVAVAASYAFALQLLLAGVVATQMSVANAASPFAICYGDPDSPGGNHGDSKSPATHQACAVCTLASSCSLVVHAAAALTLRIERTIAFEIPANATARPEPWPSPRSSQGPPQNV